MLYNKMTKKKRRRECGRFDGRADEAQRVQELAPFYVVLLLASLLFRYLPRTLNGWFYLILRIFATTKSYQFLCSYLL